ncbi:hypothetical protein [Priestia koreensis]|uniref:hypothetical protein n=1 Tax=Priestia koreensis TaxID=284581 RepID=UPI000A70E5EA|nr:hypothetical protein [Priestia koreensis]MCM3002797.1 hypothetical protein [Priestia koreensis]UNL84489.1 hypothetical protein IE339_20505 [Priestia koreensis]
MSEKKRPQNQFEYNEQGDQETSQQIMDAYSSGVVGGEHPSQTTQSTKDTQEEM